MAQVVLHEYVPFPAEPISSHEIPNLDKLQAKLGLHDESYQRRNFRSELIQFRRSHITQDGQPGDNLLQWTETEVQRELGIMAEAFLESGAGNRFWAAERPWVSEGDLVYPRDKARIIVYLKQCIFKQNQYSQINNPRALNANGFVARDEPTENGSESPTASRESPLVSFISTENPPRRRTSTSKTPKRSLNVQNDSEKEDSDSDHSLIFEDIQSKSTDRVRKKRKESSSKPWVRRTNRPRKTITKPGFVPDVELESLDGDFIETGGRVCEPKEDGVAPVADMGVDMPSGEISTIFPPRERSVVLQPRIEEPQLYLRSQFPQSSYLDAAWTIKPQPLKTNGLRTDTTITDNVLSNNVTEVEWNRNQEFAFRWAQIQAAPQRMEGVFEQLEVERNQITHPLNIPSPSTPSLGPSQATEEGETRVEQENDPTIGQAVQNSNTLTAVAQHAEPNTTTIEVRTSTEPHQFAQLPSLTMRPSPVPLRHKSSSSQPSQTTESQARLHLPSPPPPRPPKVLQPKPASETIPLWIITQTVEEEWSGPKLLDLSLPAFQSAIAAQTTSSSQNIEEIKVSLLGPKTIKMKVLRNEGEAKWEYVKSKLAENIKRFRRANRMEELWINVEPVWEKKTEVVDIVGETDKDDDVEADF